MSDVLNTLWSYVSSSKIYYPTNVWLKVLSLFNIKALCYANAIVKYVRFSLNTNSIFRREIMANEIAMYPFLVTKQTLLSSAIKNKYMLSSEAVKVFSTYYCLLENKSNVCLVLGHQLKKLHLEVLR